MDASRPQIDNVCFTGVNMVVSCIYKYNLLVSHHTLAVLLADIPRKEDQFPGKETACRASQWAGWFCWTCQQGNQRIQSTCLTAVSTCPGASGNHQGRALRLVHNILWRIKKYHKNTMCLQGSLLSMCVTERISLMIVYHCDTIYCTFIITSIPIR